ncbi:hypothetical protein HXX25_09340 [Hyphobacterium sp. CCMP332]|jgi:hypothetical protein|uniref:hypothetical protein n=1 Tax=Hyphobacterium sp. CCMP332 TaxID=2749086 RepID=UPI001650788E|nr:hypothetical protein [Hyphobacterium sp. CCMP332]QNL19501.1 hypothetical protein HXX25_09340 [Hyphobacterium sp. CCMP332]
MVRLAVFLTVLMLVLTGMTASAVAFTRGNVDAGIAFLWPALAIALVLGLAMPGRKTA